MPAIETVAAAPANDADNRPVRRWPSPRRRPQYEQWYAIVLHPTQPLALWFRHSLLQRADGGAEAMLWALVRDARPGRRDRRLTQPVALDEVRFERARFGLHLGEHAFFNNGLARGRVAAPDGAVAWDLRFEPADHTFRSVASRWLARAIARSQHTSPNSRAELRGELRLGDEVIALDGAVLTQGHTFGRVMQAGWVWGACPRFDDAPDCAFEGVATRRGDRLLMSCELTVDGQRHAFNQLHHLYGRGLGLLGHGTRVVVEPGSWRFSLRDPQLAVEGRWSADLASALRVRYTDVDGSARYNANQLLGTLELDVQEASGRRRLLRCQGRAPFEFVARDPPVGDAADYLPLAD